MNAVMNLQPQATSLYDILLGIQYASIILMLFMCAYITKKWTKPLHGWLFFYCITTLINTAGYFAVMHAKTLGEAILAWQVSYLGRSWISFAFLGFVTVLCKGRTCLFPTGITAPIHAIIYLLVITMRYNKLYYTDAAFVEDGIFPHLTMGNGILHHFYSILILIYIIYGLQLLFVSLYKQKNPHKKKQLIYITAAVISDSIFYIMQLYKIIPGYDLTNLGYTFASILLCIAIFRYDILDTKELARTFVIERVSEGIIAINEEDSVSFCNKKAMELFPSIENTPSKTLSNIRKLLAKDEPFKTNGKIYSIKEDILESKGHTAGKVYVITDDTDHFHYIEELKEQKLIADKANRAKSDFLSSMSHEIRTPINAVLGLDEMILRESTEENIRNYAHDIQSSGKSLLAIINDILDMSKIEAGKMEIIENDYDLRVLLNDLFNMILPRAQDKGLKFNINADKDMPYLLKGDDTRIRQCVLNLLSNAVKYTQKGSVTLTVGYSKINDSKISLSFSVTDTGIGIKAQDMEKLSKPFERIEENRNRAIEGTGLGISIVTGLLEKMGSKIKVESIYGEGSTFSFEVVQPVCNWKEIGTIKEALKELRTKTESYKENFQAPTVRILVVDDTPMNLTVMKGLLKQTRIIVDTADGADLALKKARDSLYDIIFIDHYMPDKDGIQMLNELRKDTSSVNNKTICVALTANAVIGAKQMYLDAGFENYLSKPVDSKKLEEMLMHYLPKEKLIFEGQKEFVKQEDIKAAGSSSSDSLFNKLFCIDIVSALNNCSGTETFMEIAELFFDSIEEKSNKIEKYVQEEDWKNYTVLVHALKSSARLIGATELSELAKELEASGDKAQKADKNAEKDIFERTPHLLELYRSYTERLAFLCGKTISIQKSSVPNISDKDISEALSALRESVQAFDFDMADNIISQLDSYILPESFHSKYKKIRNAVKAVDRAAILELLEE